MNWFKEVFHSGSFLSDVCSCFWSVWFELVWLFKDWLLIGGESGRCLDATAPAQTVNMVIGSRWRLWIGDIWAWFLDWSQLKDLSWSQTVHQLIFSNSFRLFSTGAADRLWSDSWSGQTQTSAWDWRKEYYMWDTSSQRHRPACSSLLMTPEILKLLHQAEQSDPLFPCRTSASKVLSLIHWRWRSDETTGTSSSAEQTPDRREWKHTEGNADP